MSWSVAANGKAVDVAATIENQFETRGACMEPEESIRQSARKLIAESLKAQIPSDKDVRVSAYGSQSVRGMLGGAPDEIRNSLSITITPEN